MKKYILIFSLLLLTSCFGFWEDNDEISETKKKILWWETEQSSLVNSWKVEETMSWTTDIFSSSWTTENENFVEEDKEIDKEKTNYLEINNLTEEKFIELDNLNVSDFADFQEEITWKTLASVDKIIVKFSNADSSFPEDSFTLKKFKKGDKTFLYRAFKKYEVLDYGKNIYVFEAHSWDEVSTLELIVNLVKEEEKPVESVDLNNLPSWWDFWETKVLSNWDVTYSNIDSLVLKNVWEIDLKSDDSTTVTKYLPSVVDWHFYWNTFRTIKNKKGISYFVVEQKSGKYTYSKHYYNWNGIYGILTLDSWDVDWKTLKELNTELKEKNAEYDSVKVVDNLFSKITN